VERVFVAGRKPGLGVEEPAQSGPTVRSPLIGP
jgi:hypothetical protein